MNPDELQEAVRNGLDKFDLASSKSLILKDLKELFYKKETNRDERYKLQCTKMKPINMREKLNLKESKYPQEDLEVVFEKSKVILETKNGETKEYLPLGIYLTNEDFFYFKIH